MNIKWKFFWGLLVLIAVCLALWISRDQIALFFDFIRDRNALQAYVHSFGLLGPLVLAAFHAIQILVSIIPGDAFFIAAGYVYGLPVGFALNLLITTCVSLLAFTIARTWGRRVVDRLAPAHIIDRWDRAAQQYGMQFFLISFLLPLFPADTMNYLAGLSPISTKKFALAVVVGRGPMIFLITLLGAHGADLASVGLTPPAWIATVVVVVMVYLIWLRFFSKIIREMIHKADPSATAKR